MENIDQRIEKTSYLTLKVAEFLEKSDKTNEVKYPLLKKHYSYERSVKWFNKDSNNNSLGPSVLIFSLKGSKSKVNKFLKNWFKK